MPYCLSLGFYKVRREGNQEDLNMGLDRSSLKNLSW